jgi:hypothetical protein
MAQHSELKGFYAETGKDKAGNDLAQRDLDKISGGANPQTTMTLPSGPIRYPMH